MVNVNLLDLCDVITIPCLFVLITLAAGGMDDGEENSERTNSEVSYALFYSVLLWYT